MAIAKLWNKTRLVTQTFHSVDPCVCDSSFCLSHTHTYLPLPQKHAHIQSHCLPHAHALTVAYTLARVHVCKQTGGSHTGGLEKRRRGPAYVRARGRATSVDAQVAAAPHRRRPPTPHNLPGGCEQWPHCPLLRQTPGSLLWIMRHHETS